MAALSVVICNKSAKIIFARQFFNISRMDLEEYKKVIEFIEEFIKINPKLDKEECDILSTGFKNMITDKERVGSY